MTQPELEARLRDLLLASAAKISALEVQAAEYKTETARLVLEHTRAVLATPFEVATPGPKKGALS